MPSKQCSSSSLFTDLHPVSSFILDLHLQEIPGPFVLTEAQSKTASTVEAVNTQRFAQQLLGFASRSSGTSLGMVGRLLELFGNLNAAAPTTTAAAG